MRKLKSHTSKPDLSEENQDVKHSAPGRGPKDDMSRKVAGDYRGTLKSQKERKSKEDGRSAKTTLGDLLSRSQELSDDKKKALLQQFLKQALGLLKANPDLMPLVHEFHTQAVELCLPVELSTAQQRAVQKVSKTTRWRDRENRWEQPPEFIRRNYGQWLGIGLTQAHLRADVDLYNALQNWLQKNSLPDDFGLPSKKELTNKMAAAMGLRNNEMAHKVASRLNKRAQNQRLRN